jgi:outer membrane protein insertion porin family
MFNTISTLKKLFFIHLLSFLWLFFFDSAFAKESSKIIEIKGNIRVEKETIAAFFDQNILAKKNISQSEIEEILKKIYQSELFSEVKINQANNKILVEVVENPYVSEVKFIGNKKIDDEVLTSEISLKKRSLFTKSKLQSDLKRINEIYLKSGRFLAQIEPKIIAKEQNRIEVIFEISEGKKAKIDNIFFIGNANFSDQDLLDEISTKKSKWYKFFSSSDVYDSDRIEFDKEKLRRFYASKGYADFTTISSIAQINKKRDAFFITFLIEEGIKYKVGEIRIINQIAKFDEKILYPEIQIKSKRTYNADLVDKSVDLMSKIMSDNSYAFANIEPVLKRNKEEKIIDIDFIIRETLPVYIDQITIRGNVRTIDDVILRELRVKDGDAYNLNKINRSKQRLENLGYFEKVEFNTKRIADSNKVDLEIIVKEKKTGELNLGLGYSTIDRATANIGIRERNLMGTGRDLGINLQRSFARFTAEVNYTKPYFTGRPIDAGFDIFQYQLAKRNTLLYDQDSQGITLRANYSITEFLKHQLRYSYRTEKISNVDESASFNIQSLQGDFSYSTIGQTFFYDKRDNLLNPTSGYYASISQEYTGLGGFIKNIKYEGSAGYYLPTINDEFILKFLGRGGYINGSGQDVRSNDGFFLGGNNFRGFDFAGLGPRTIENGSADGGSIVGGKKYYVATAEFRFPLGLPKELGISAALFSDNGTVTGVDAINKNGNDVADSGSIRSSYGLSIIWSSPLGPIRLDFAKAAKKEDYDITQGFRFNFGSNF